MITLVADDALMEVVNKIVSVVEPHVAVAVAESLKKFNPVPKRGNGPAVYIERGGKKVLIHARSVIYATLSSSPLAELMVADVETCVHLSRDVSLFNNFLELRLWEICVLVEFFFAGLSCPALKRLVKGDTLEI
jgi:hypothetical protein